MANLVRGTFLRIADVRSQPANISVAASRSIPSRRVVPSPTLPDRRHHRTPTLPSTDHALQRELSAAPNHPIHQANRRLDKPFHISRALSGRRAGWSSVAEPAWRGTSAGGAGAGPTAQQGLQLVEQLPQGQADAAGFGRRSRSRVRKPWATDTNVTW